MSVPGGSERVRAVAGCSPRAPLPATARYGAVAAGGARAAGRREDYALLVEAIHEGYLLHYGVRARRAPDDPDLALLAGDRLYALGLARLAELGDLEAVGELADVISLAAQAHAEGDPDARRRRLGGRARARWATVRPRTTRPSRPRGAAPR